MRRIVKNILWALAGIFILVWIWRWIQQQGGVAQVFRMLFPARVTPPVQMPIEDEVAPPELRPAPPVAPPRPPVTPPAPVHPELPAGLTMSDRLPWENNRLRGEVISALRRDIARVEGMPRQWANTMPEVKAVGGVDNYLSLQRERLNRALTQPMTPFIGPPAPAPTPAAVNAAIQPAIDTPYLQPRVLTPAPTPTPILAPAPAPIIHPVMERSGDRPPIFDDPALTPGIHPVIHPVVMVRRGDQPPIFDDPALAPAFLEF